MVYANDTMQLLFERGSCRSFEDRPIDPRIINDILGAGLHAASGGNLQPYSIIKIQSEPQKDALVNLCGMQALVKEAPLNLLFCLDWRRNGRWAEAENAPFVALDSAKHFWIGFQDVIIAAQSVCTAADSYKLGSVYIGTVESCFDQLRDLCELPEGVLPVVLVSIGYPKEPIAIANKLMQEATVHDGVYKDTPIERLLALQNEKYEDKTFPLSDTNLAAITEVFNDVLPKDQAQDALATLKSSGHINMAQRYFGLHYKANWSCSKNADLVKALKDAGFTWTDGIDFPKV